MTTEPTKSKPRPKPLIPKQRVARVLLEALWDRLIVHKIDLLTHLGKRVLPAGYWHGLGHEEPSVYLTFDDGPNPHTTPQILAMLAEYDVKATFFLVGENCARYPHLVKQIHEAGHFIGNHTFTHSMLPLMPLRQLESEIVKTSELIEKIIGEKPVLFRPPFGLMDERAGKLLKKHGLIAVYWGVAPEDWLIPGTQRVIRRVMWKIADGTLIVLHEGGHLASQTVDAASEIIYRCRTLGYQFAKVNVRA